MTLAKKMVTFTAAVGLAASLGAASQAKELKLAHFASTKYHLQHRISAAGLSHYYNLN